MTDSTALDKLRWELFKALSSLGWWICPEPHRSNLGTIWHAQMGEFKDAVAEIEPLDNLVVCDTDLESENRRLKEALEAILDGAQNQGPFTGMCWQDVRQICTDALREPSV